MARRNFIKAYNDMVGGTSQSNVGGMNISEFVENRVGVIARDVESFSRRSPTSVPSKDKSRLSRYVVNPKMKYKPATPKVAQGQQTGWDGIRRKQKNTFIDIDGETFPTEELDKAVDVVDTSHKIQRHISLVDLARPYLPRAASPNSTNMVQNTQEKEEILELPQPRTLPKGFSDTDQPYILPKFTPTLREMIYTKAKPKDTLVSITESTPPSMQKWAVDWNSEPKHSISITELKEDLQREKYERIRSGVGSPKDLIFAEDESFSPKPNMRQELSEPQKPEIFHESTVQKPLVNHHSKLSDKNDYEFYDKREFLNSKQTERTLKQSGFKSPEVRLGQQPSISQQSSIDWLPEKYNELKKRFNEKHTTKYSFSSALKEVENDGKRDGSPSSKAPQLKNKHTSIYDDRKQEFHAWFRNRLTRTSKDEHGNNEATIGSAASKDRGSKAYNDVMCSDPYSVGDNKDGLSSVLYSEGDPTRFQTKQKPNNSLIKSGKIEDEQCKMTPDITNQPGEDAQKKPSPSLAERYTAEGNSSFYHWLKQRGVVNLLKNKTNVETPRKTPPSPQSGRSEDVAKSGSKFPWSKAYLCKYAPKNGTNTKPKNESKPASRYVTPEPSRDGVPSRKSITQVDNRKEMCAFKKVKSLGSFSVLGAKRSGNPQGKSRAKKIRQAIGKVDRRFEQISERIPYYGWVVSNELEHIKNLRLLENQHASPIVQNRKKLFPTLQDTLAPAVASSMNYWESKYLEPSASQKTNEQSPNDKSEDKHNFIKSLTRSPQLFKDENFTNISEETTPVKTTFGESDEMDKLKSSRSFEDEMKISRYADKVSQQIGEKLSSGNPTLIAKPPLTLEDSPLCLQLTQNSTKSEEDKVQEDNIDEITTQKTQEERFPVESSETEFKAEVDDDWINMIGPKDFNLNSDGDLLHLLKKSSPQVESS